jgi:hypothetical protein
LGSQVVDRTSLFRGIVKVSAGELVL